MGVPWWSAVCLLFTAALAQASLLPSVGFVTRRPDLVLACVVIWAALRGLREALPWAFVGGMMLDLLSGAPLGTASLALVLVASCASAGIGTIFPRNLFLPIVMVIVFGASLLYSVIYLFLLRTHEIPVEWSAALRQIVVPNALLNAVVSPVLYVLLSRLERATRRRLAVEW